MKTKLQSFKKALSFLFRKKKETEMIHQDEGIDEAISFTADNEIQISGAIRILMVVIFFITILAIWAYFSTIDEVSKGNGKVVPISKEQVIQSLDGGILQKINVREGQIVEKNEIIAQLDVIRTESNVDEQEAKYRTLLAQKARLDSEVNGVSLKFPPELDKHPDLILSETRLYNSRFNQFNDAIKDIQDSRRLLQSELDINTRLAKLGAASSVDLIRLKKQLVDLNMQENTLKKEYYVRSREELSKVSGEISSLSHIIRGRRDLLSKSTIVSPVRGIVKDIEISTIGGVVPPNGKLMQIVPLDDKLLIEAHISPRDIAFIHPKQKANVKITAYDYSIYGGLDGEVTTISPDTIKDENKPDVVYYRVYIQTHQDYLLNKNNKKLFITPGMVSTVDIKTGKKTVAQYLMKPFNKINEALRER